MFALAAAKRSMRRSRTKLRRALLALLGAAACGGAAPVPAPRCPADGEIAVIASRGDVVRLADCASAGGLIVRSAAALDVSGLRALAVIRGDLVIGPTVAVDQVSLGALREVGGTIRVVGNGLLQRLHLPALERAGRIDIDGNPALAAIALPRLREVGGALRITDNAALEIVDASALAVIARELVIASDPALTLLDAPALQRAGAVQIDAAKLPADEIERLRAIAAP
jgi:hypothetical protein